MTYQALARSWRPQRFDELVGQAHVVKALSNALEQGRVHHAFLFTGTRGVGKTTIARILAKCLNCEQGVSATPCGECSTCQEIDQGRHPDLIEVDAASRAKVDETRELMNNVQFAPTRGRHKVYLIDEVHMFSDASFNALLKTLEEPPPHVKFLLATTDPQRMPVTVLSRCLQFSLKRLPAEQIADRLVKILEAEGVAFEEPALRLLARAADGSLRDALSLLDQAIAHGGGSVEAEPVRAMLGLLDRGHIRGLLERLAAGDGAGLLAKVEAMSGDVADFGEALAELLGALKQVAVMQAVPEAVVDDEDADWLGELAEGMPAEDVQLYYQIGLIGRRDLPLAPDPRSGFEMTLLRMLAFAPESGAPAPAAATPGGRSARPAAGAVRSASASAAPAATNRDTAQPAPEPGTQAQRGVAAESVGEESIAAPPGERDAGEAQTVLPQPPAAAGEWPTMVAALGLGGMVRELASNCELLGIDDGRVQLRIAPEHRQLTVGRGRARLEKALSEHLGYAVTVDLQVGARASETPAEIERRNASVRRAAAAQELRDDPGVNALLDAFGGSIEADSVRPVD